AVAIAAATTAWVIVSASVLQPIPGASTDRWFVVHETRDDGATGFGFMYPALAAIREAGIFEHVGATWLGAGDLLVNHDRVADSVHPAFVTHDVLPGLGVRLEAGRHFTADEDRRGAAPVLPLSDRAVRQVFA